MRTWILLLLLAVPLQARVLTVGAGGYSSLEAAARDAVPGDTIRFSAGVHAGGSYVSDLRGTPELWIVISGPAQGEARIAGGGSAMQLTDPAYLRIEHLIFEGQTGNGVNIDDGGSYETPAQHIVIEQCTFRDMNATGNNDLLKMSGVDNFEIRQCTFLNGSAGGSMIDMVGCHLGVFENNTFTNGGSNSIQAKGGTSDILITGNSFINGGQRAINIGGSTGLQFFRPIDATYEAARIKVYANLFRGGMAPFAYVGAVNCDVANNTVLYPDKWVMRILQETTDARFLPCGDNFFRNNVVVVDNRAISPSVNIGGNTLPETFIFANNLWYNSEQPSWAGPTLPSTETDGRYRTNPMLRDIVSNDIFPLPGSAAIGAGLAIPGLVFDVLGARYNTPPSIGAVEGNPLTTSITSSPSPTVSGLNAFPQPAGDYVHIVAETRGSTSDAVLLYDLTGRCMGKAEMYADGSGRLFGSMPTTQLPGGVYVLVMQSQPHRRMLLTVGR